MSKLLGDAKLTQKLVTGTKEPMDTREARRAVAVWSAVCRVPDAASVLERSLSASSHA